MQCSRCQQDNTIHARFCLGCGALLALVCGACGAELPQEARFCLECRHVLAGRPAAPARATAPKAYTPKYLAEKRPFDDMRRWSIATPRRLADE